MNYSAIILLGGKSTRFGHDLNKVYYLINDKPIFCYSIDLFLNDCDCQEIIVVYNKDDESILKKYLENYPNVLTTIGGKLRYQSVLEGLKLATKEYVLVHDGARPNVSMEMLENLKESLLKNHAVSLGTHVTDTIKKVTNSSFETIDRDSLYAVQTPQGCKRNLLMGALSKVKDTDNITDDLMAIEMYTDIVPSIVLGSRNNIKVTTYEDYLYLKCLMGDKNV